MSLTLTLSPVPGRGNQTNRPSPPWYTSLDDRHARLHPGGGFFREDARKIVLSAVLIVLSTLAAMAQPFPLMIMVDSVLAERPPEHWVYRAFFAVAGVEAEQIAAAAVITLLLRVLQESLQVWQGALKVRISYNGLIRVRSQLFRQLSNSASRTTGPTRRGTRSTGWCTTRRACSRRSTSCRARSSTWRRCW